MFHLIHTLTTAFGSSLGSNGVVCALGKPFELRPRHAIDHTKVGLRYQSNGGYLLIRMGDSAEVELS